MKTHNSKIYIHTPCNSATGGIELLHQLAHFLRNNGVEAYTVLFGSGQHVIHPEYQKYNVCCIEEDAIENCSDCLEVYTEVMGNELLANNRITQKFMWWLSVDNFYKLSNDKICLWDLYIWDKKIWIEQLKIRFNLSLYYHRNEFENKVGLRVFNERGVMFGYQCEYIYHHLKKAGINNSIPLSDYINTDYVAINSLDRENIVLYNPSKGLEFTKKLIAAAPNINWTPIAGYNRKSLSELMSRSKLYIDFGNHPGKDRLPRECAIKGCCIITGMRGSAAFQDDVDIPSKYKFDEKTSSIDTIIERIKSTLSNYNECIKDFGHYRQKILCEKEVFENEIRLIFEIGESI